MTTGVPDSKNGADHHADALAALRAQAEQLSQRIEALSQPAATTPDHEGAGDKPDAPFDPPSATPAAGGDDPVLPQRGVEAAPAPVPPEPDSAVEGERRPGVRLSDLPSPVAKASPLRRAAWIVVVLVLVAGAFLGGIAWTEYQREQSGPSDQAAQAPATETAAASGASATSGGAPDAAAVRDDRRGETTETAPVEPTAEEAPASTVPPDSATVLAAAETALDDAGHGGFEITYADGALILDGVIPHGAAADGYFAYVETVRDAVDHIAGVDTVTPRLFLRGDDSALRSALQRLVADQPIEFEFGSADLVVGAEATLQAAAEAILAHPGLRVLVAGHTDSSGSTETNATLAAARAETVVRELAARGVPVTRLDAVAYGELFPGAQSTDEQNRRVEFEVAP